MKSASAPIPEINLASEAGRRSRRMIADLVRSIVHSRRGISRIAVLEWVEQFVNGADRAEVASTIQSVIDALCELNDVGFGTIHGEPVLVALPERRVALPDGRIIVLGDHGVRSATDSEMLFPEVETGATETLIDLLQDLDNVGAANGIGSLPANGQWTSADAMPSALERALTLCGAFDPVNQEWSTSSVNAAFLNEWFNLGDARADTDASDELDASQQRVVRAPTGSRLVVEAGPGSGKTHVACERVIALVQDEGLAPSRILLLSFTRIAVAELRARVAANVTEVPNIAALQIRTFDSFAARLLSASDNGVAGGFDASIRAAIRLMRSGNPLIADAIGQLEHVIIDEAQDLVGDRKTLCEVLVDSLHANCGVTVFGDFAQSIYGYQRRDKTGATFLTDITAHADFVSERLERDHRTRTEALREMFYSVREILRDDPNGSRESYFSVREKLRAAALENDIAKFATHPSTTSGLILTRSRKGLITAAEAMRAEGRRFRLRLPDRPLRIEPWIGAVLGGLPPSERISRDAFSELHDTLNPPVARDVEGCWDILRDLDGSGRDTILIGHVAEALEEPPLELISDHEGSGGPLLSTIHAIKGREDQRAMLLFSKAPHGDEVDWAEEARTLYVGATRASTELRTGWVNPAKLYTVGKPERYWAAHPDHRLIEIGLEGDIIDWRDFLLMGYAANQRETIAAIWTALAEGFQVEAVPDSARCLIVRGAGKDSLPLCCLSSGFAEVVQSIRQVAADAPLPEVISGFSVVGATTVVVPGEAGNGAGLALVPLLGGFARVAR